MLNLGSIIKNHGWILVAFVVIVILAIPFFLSSFKNNHGNVSSPSGNYFQTTPTPLPFRKVSVVSTTPQNNTTSANLDSTISATFSQPLSSSQRAEVSFLISPATSGSATWSTDGTTVTFQQSDLLNSGSTYSATISYFGQLYSWKFTTQTLPQSSVNYGLQQQTILDEKYAQRQQQTYNNYPWYDSLPLSGSNYFTVFNPASNTFETSVYTTASSNQSQTDQIQNIESEVKSQLQQLGIDFKKYKFQWDINPTPGS